MKKLSIFLTFLALGSAGLTQANAQDTNQFNKKEMVISMDSILKKFQENNGRINNYTNLNGLIDAPTDRAFNIETHNIKVNLIDTAATQNAKAYLYNSKAVHKEIKSFPVGSLLKNNYLVVSHLNNGDKLLYTVVSNSNGSKGLSNAFYNQGVLDFIDTQLSKKSDYKISEIDTEVKLNNLSIKHLRKFDKDFNVVYGSQLDRGNTIYFALISNK